MGVSRVLGSRIQSTHGTHMLWVNTHEQKKNFISSISYKNVYAIGILFCVWFMEHFVNAASIMTHAILSTRTPCHFAGCVAHVSYVMWTCNQLYVYTLCPDVSPNWWWNNLKLLFFSLYYYYDFIKKHRCKFNILILEVQKNMTTGSDINVTFNPHYHRLSTNN